MRKVFAAFAAVCVALTGCGTKKKVPEQSQQGLKIVGSMELNYAEQFSVDYCDDGLSVITIGEDSFLLVPEGADIPEGTDGYTILKQPLENMYVAATSAMDLIDAAGGLDKVEMISTDLEGWSLPNIREAIANEELAYIGKYSAPDYEILTEWECNLAIESTMIYHSPEVKEQLEALGIPVLVERSSYEAHPLGRMEWIKLYGLLLGKAEEAERFFNEEISEFEALDIADISDDERKTAAFFYISSNGYVNIRKPGDYISQMIELAGGKYIFTAKELNVEENALSTMNIQLEAFYEKAKDADVLIYNSTVEGELDSTQQLLEKNAIFADFKAVKEGNVWCTGQNMFQQTTGAADMIIDLNRIFTGADEREALTYLRRLS